MLCQNCILIYLVFSIKLWVVLSILDNVWISDDSEQYISTEGNKGEPFIHHLKFEYLNFIPEG